MSDLRIAGLMVVSLLCSVYLQADEPAVLPMDDVAIVQSGEPELSPLYAGLSDPFKELPPVMDSSDHFLYIKKLIDSPTLDFFPTVAPDRKSLLFLRADAGTGIERGKRGIASIWCLDLQGGSPPMKVTSEPFGLEIACIVWARDGKSIFFSGSRTGWQEDYEVFTIPFAPERFPLSYPQWTPVTNLFIPSWDSVHDAHPDGDKLLVHSGGAILYLLSGLKEDPPKDDYPPYGRDIVSPLGCNTKGGLFTQDGSRGPAS